MTSKIIQPAGITPGTPRYLQATVDVAKLDAKHIARDAVPFVGRLAEIRSLDWKSLVESGEWSDFCESVLGVPAAFVSEIEDGVEALVATGRTGPIPAAEAVQRARDQAETIGQGTRTDLQHGADGTKLSRGTNSREHLLRRLARDHPEILDAFERGEYASVRQAAIAAGIVKVPSQLDALRKAWRKATDEERGEFLDWLQREAS